MNVLTALAVADPVRDRETPYDERLLAEIVATPRLATRPKRSRKVVVAAWLSVILVPLAGVGAAGAAGIIPDGARGAFPWAAGDGHGLPTLDLTTATRVFVEPGPDDTRFEVWRALGDKGYECLSFNFVSAEATPAVPRALLSQAGGACGTQQEMSPFGGAGGTGGTGKPTTFAVFAGGAVRATLTLGGVVAPLQVQNGLIAGWLPAGEPTRGATVTGYAADGTVVGTNDVGLDPPP